MFNNKIDKYLKPMASLSTWCFALDGNIVKPYQWRAPTQEIGDGEVEEEVVGDGPHAAVEQNHEEHDDVARHGKQEEGNVGGDEHYRARPVVRVETGKEAVHDRVNTVPEPRVHSGVLRRRVGAGQAFPRQVGRHVCDAVVCERHDDYVINIYKYAVLAPQFLGTRMAFVFIGIYWDIQLRWAGAISFR